MGLEEIGWVRDVLFLSRGKYQKGWAEDGWPIREKIGDGGMGWGEAERKFFWF